MSYWLGFGILIQQVVSPVFRYHQWGSDFERQKFLVKDHLVFNLDQLIIRKMHHRLHAISQNNSLRKLESVRFNV